MKKDTKERLDKMINTEMDNIERMQEAQKYDIKQYACLEKLVKMDNEINESKKNRCVEYAKIGAGIVGQIAITGITLGAYDKFLVRGYKFEESGTIGSQTNRSILLSKLLPKLK